MQNIHDIQLQILNRLLFAKSLRYTEAKPEREMENNQYQFHLDQLLKKELIKKTKSGYSLSTKGKEYATRIDTEKVKVKKQAKISARICCIRNKNSKKQFLLYTRLKHPFYGCQGFPAGKVSFGEGILEAAKRELREETNLIGEPKLALITHYSTYERSSAVDDRLMFVCIVMSPEGKLKSCKEGRYEWVDDKKIEKFVTKPFESKKSFMREVELLKRFRGSIKFVEGRYENIESF